MILTFCDVSLLLISHLGVCGTASFSLPQTTALLPLLFRSIEKEVDYALQNFASQEAVINASVAPTVGISSSSVTPTITSLPAIKEPFIESSNEPSLSSQKRTQPAMISLPDLSLDGDAQLILIIDLMQFMTMMQSLSLISG